MEKIKVPKGYRIVKVARNEKLQLLTTPAVKEEVRAEAEKMGISINELLNRILNDRYGFENEIDFERF